MGTSASLETTHRSLNTAGMRVSNQRSLIMDARQREGDLGGDGIYHWIQERGLNLSLSTALCRNIFVLLIASKSHKGEGFDGKESIR